VQANQPEIESPKTQELVTVAQRESTRLVNAEMLGSSPAGHRQTSIEHCHCMNKRKQKGKRPSKNGHVPISAKGRRKPKFDHVSISDQIVHRRLSEIRPSPKNDSLYNPIDRGDPDFIKFVDSCRCGIREALFISIDGFIISGHRRYSAAEIIPLETVPCRTVNIDHAAPQFLPLLRECNRQRTKTLDEILREEVVSANPEESHRLLLEYRRQASQVKVETGIIHGTKHRAVITDAKKPFMDSIKAILDRLRDYWPLSDRLIHYQLLNGPPLIHARKRGSTYRNDQHSYKALTELLTRARIAGVIPFEAIHDPTRPVTTWDVFNSPGPFIRVQLEDFLKGYYRNLQRSQPVHIEILGEKNTIASIIRPVAMEYCIPFTLGRGYSSLPPRHDMAKRFQRSGKDSLLLLVLSDCDPEGQDIAHSFARSMRDDFEIERIKFIQVALTRAQVDELGLPPGTTAKAGSSRRRKFVEQNGEHVFELEAAEPDRLQTMLRQTIDSVMDMELFNAEIEREKQDAARLDVIRRRVIASMGDLATEMEDDE
jgi:hypothetical protein